jgi:hypothetical protein
MTKRHERHSTIFYNSGIGESVLWQGRSLQGELAVSLRSYAARVKRFGIERIREIARENGKGGGRPPKKGKSR